MQSKPRHAPAATRQRGQAAIILLLIVGFGVAALVFGMATPGKESIEGDKKTAAALAQAKEALIGYAASDSNRPGSLPCPDADSNGNAEPFVGSECPGYVAGSNVYIGRLPWKTLGLPDPREGSGESLWYAVSRAFARNPSCGAACPLNSETTGQLTVNGVPSYANAIAVMFAPGPVLGAQTRDMANANVIGNHLEGENANGDAIFASADATATFNDRLTVLTREALFPTVELRVAREVRLSLQNYFTANQYYPFAAPLPSAMSAAGTYRGYVPTGATPPCNPPTTDLSPLLPAWFTTNNWQQFMVYAVAPRCTARIEFNVDITISILASPPACSIGCIGLPPLLQVCTLSQAVDTGTLNCANAGGYLTADGANNVRAIVLPASYRLGAQNRPCANMSDCLEVVSGNNENIDADNTYMKPVRSATNNDNLVVVAP